MTKQEFAQQIKLKYPQYKDMDDEELANKTLDKYPVYQSQITEKGVLRKVADFFTSSSQKFGTTLGTAASVVSPEVNKNREATLNLAQSQSSNYIKLAQQTTDKNKKKAYLEAAKKSASTEGVDIFNNPEYQKTAKQVFGEGLGTALEVASLGSFGAKGLQTGVLGKALPTVLKPLSMGKEILSSAKMGAKFGGAFGAGMGVSGAMQEDKSIGDIAKEGALSGTVGAIGGAVIGGGISGAIGGTSRLVSKAAKLTPVIQNKVGEVVYNKLNQVSRDLVKMSPTASKNEAKWGKNTPKFLVDEGIVSLIESDGKKISTAAAKEALKLKYNAEAEAFNSVLSNSGEYVSLNKLKQRTVESLSYLKNRGSDYDDAIKQVEKEIESYKKNYLDKGLVQGDDVLINIEDFNKIKSGLWQKTSNFNPTMSDKLLSDTNYRMGHTAKDLIEETVSDAGIKSMSSRLGDFASAMRVLDNAEGKALPGGFFGKQFTRLAGTIAGSSAGIPGSIIGNLTGGVLADFMSNPRTRTIVLSKLNSKLNKTEAGRSIIEEAANILKQRGLERDARKLLEAPSFIPAGVKQDTSKLFTQQEIEELNKVGGLFEYNQRNIQAQKAAGIYKPKN